MKRLFLWLLAVLLMPAFAWATEELGVVGQQSIDVTRSSGSATAIYPMTKTATGSLTGLDTLLSGEDQTNNLIMTSGGAVRTTTVASGMVVGGDGTMTTAVAVPTGSKSFNGIITGTGAITQTQKLYGGFNSPITTTNGTLLCTLTLSGTTETSDTCPVVTANFPYYGVLTSGTTGTSATGVMKVGY